MKGRCIVESNGININIANTLYRSVHILLHIPLTLCEILFKQYAHRIERTHTPKNKENLHACIHTTRTVGKRVHTHVMTYANISKRKQAIYNSVIFL